MKYSLFVILFFYASALFAQQKNVPVKKVSKISKSDKEIKVMMSTEESVGAGLNTNGWSLLYNKTKIIHFTKKKYWEIECSKIRGEKETKTEPTDIEGYIISPKNYVYGKRNSLFVFEYRKGYNYKLSQKSVNNGVEISLNTSVGATLGLLKPYYLVLKRITPDHTIEFSEEKYNSNNAAAFLRQDSLSGIYGYSGFWKGMFETTPVPALNARVGLNFDWAAYDENISALEIGLKVNMFLAPIPLMANKNNHQIFPSFFAIYKIGSRKY
ncbi:MAG: hypothetical protein RI955_847 [Bacteroidota bacterium]